MNRTKLAPISSLVLLAAFLALAAASCGGSRPATPPTGQGNTSAAAAGAGGQIQGAGATFPYPLYSKWFA